MNRDYFLDLLKYERVIFFVDDEREFNLATNFRTMASRDKGTNGWTYISNANSFSIKRDPIEKAEKIILVVLPGFNNKNLITGELLNHFSFDLYYD